MTWPSDYGPSGHGDPFRGMVEYGAPRQQILPPRKPVAPVPLPPWRLRYIADALPGTEIARQCIETLKEQGHD